MIWKIHIRFIKLNITFYLLRLLDLGEIILVLSYQTYIFRILLSVQWKTLTGLTVCTDVRMYGFIYENSQKCTELGIHTWRFWGFWDFWKSVHGIFENPYMEFLKIRTFYRDYFIKKAFFRNFFRFCERTLRQTLCWNLGNSKYSKF